jgi:hypothetical protein
MGGKIMPKKQINIFDLPVVIFVEGSSDWKFMQVYTEYLFGKDQLTFYTKSVKGVDKLKTEVIDFVKALKPDCITKAILLMRDADQDANAAKQSINDIKSEIDKLRKGIPVYSYIFPFNHNESGSLETLCLQIVGDPDKEKYLAISNNAINQSDKIVPHHKQKNALYCYLSLFDEYAEWSLGINAEKGAFDLSAQALEPLKNLLYEINRII